MKTKFVSKEAALKARKWHVVDASGIPLGRLATKVAGIIRGKHKADFTPHVDGGDFVIVINADKVKLTGKKMDQKIYYRHSHFMGGIKAATAKELIEQHPDRVIARAVEGMLPDGKLGRGLRTKLKIYRDAEHPHAAQAPQAIDMSSNV